MQVVIDRRKVTVLTTLSGQLAELVTGELRIDKVSLHLSDLQFPVPERRLMWANALTEIGRELTGKNLENVWNSGDAWWDDTRFNEPLKYKLRSGLIETCTAGYEISDGYHIVKLFVTPGSTLMRTGVGLQRFGDIFMKTNFLIH